MAQSNVYSLNIVGYVNAPLQGNGHLDLISDPFIPQNGNYDITNTTALPNSYDGANLYYWGGTGWNNNVPGWISGFGWFPDAVITLGNAFFIQAPAGAPPTNVTFVGQVATGNITNTFPTGLNVPANMTPVTGPWPGGTVGHDGDSIYLWTGSAWNNTVWGYIGGYGWFGTGAVGESTNGPVVNIATGVVYQNTGAAITWVQSFNP